MGRVRNLVEEARDLGLANFAFRVGWEFRRRSGWLERSRPPAPDVSKASAFGRGGLLDLQVFAKAPDVMAAIRDQLEPSADQAIHAEADREAHGRILAFSSQILDYGDPPDWHRHPITGARSDPHAHWSHIEARDAKGGDIKFVLEVGRFPHAYRMARAAARFPEAAESWAIALTEQVEEFRRQNSFGRGVHWFSSQELALRLLAWIFACQTFESLGAETRRLRRAILESALEAGVHILEHFDYSRRSTYNNHLLSEALGLLLAGALLPGWSEAARCRTVGLTTLAEQASVQFYRDGSYILNSHNYHRGALQILLATDRICAALKEATPNSLLSAMERSLDFLFAHQNPDDGALPNYGPNDGSLPMVLSMCAFSDFRPVLGAISLRCRGERAYPRGLWDEEAAWMLGADSLQAPMAARPRESVVFTETGYVVLRGRHEDDFACLRCGNIPCRFSQIDILHLDLWWRGQNVLVDGGSYLYNGDPRWHDHFHRTASHNTVEIDGVDQMLHFRPFKNLYWTKARVRRFEVGEARLCFEGEHDGYLRLAEGVSHRREVVTDRMGAWLVRDHLLGAEEHRVRLHWLLGQFPTVFDAEGRTVRLKTPKGVLVLSVSGVPDAFHVSLVAGQEDPPRGWLARTYGERSPTPSLVVAGSARLPLTLETWVIPEESSPESFMALRRIAEERR